MGLCVLRILTAFSENLWASWDILQGFSIQQFSIIYLWHGDNLWEDKALCIFNYVA
jgi:hypothetical protein